MANSVSNDTQPFWWRLLLKQPPEVASFRVAEDRADRCGLGDCIVNGRGRQVACIVKEACIICWRVVAFVAGKDQLQAIDCVLVHVTSYYPNVHACSIA